MIRLFPLCCLALFSGFLQAGDLKNFSEPRAAISTAKDEGKLIVFLLADPKSKDQLPVIEALQVELERLSKEFVLVNCVHTVKANRDLFTGRFGKELSNLPIAVVSDAGGGEITFYQGIDLEGYQRMLISARINSGMITDPVKLASLKEALSKVGEKGGFLTPMVQDLKRDKVAITAMRDWTKKDGTVFRAILLEALGDIGVFIDEAGNPDRVKFINLSEENLQFLQTILRVEKSSE